MRHLWRQIIHYNEILSHRKTNDALQIENTSDITAVCFKAFKLCSFPRPDYYQFIIARSNILILNSELHLKKKEIGMANAMNNSTSGLPERTCFYLDRFQLFRMKPLNTEYIINCTLNGLFAIAAILGNGLILHALRKSAALRPPSRALMYSLAASDIGVGLTVQPFYVIYKTAELMNNRELYCVTGIGFHLSANVFSAVSFLTITAISVDRLLALHLGSRYQSTVSLKRVAAVIISIWALTGLWLFLWFWNIISYQLFNITVVSICLFICLLAYLWLWFKLRRLRIRAMARWKEEEESSFASTPRFGVQKRSVINMFYVYLLMFVCYVPYLSMFVVIQTTKVNSTKIAALSYTMTLLFANSAFNPFLYCFRIKEIRKEVLAALFCKWQEKRKKTMGKIFSYQAFRM